MRQVKRYAYYYCCHHSCLQLRVRTRQLHTKIVSQPPWSFCGFECFPSTEYLQSYYSMSFLLPTKIMLTGVHQHDQSIQTNWGTTYGGCCVAKYCCKATKKVEKVPPHIFCSETFKHPKHQRDQKTGQEVRLSALAFIWRSRHIDTLLLQKMRSYLREMSWMKTCCAKCVLSISP